MIWLSLTSLFFGVTSVLCQDLQCKWQGKTYKIGEHFISEDCRGKCLCEGRGSGWKVACVSLCPPYAVQCRAGEKIEYVDSPVGQGSKCTCRRPVCAPVLSMDVKCNFRGKTYPIGKQFISEDCKGQCECKRRGSTGWNVACVPLCPLSNVQCMAGEKIEYVEAPVKDSTCTCRRPVCVSAAKEKVCKANGKVYKPGETYVPDSCGALCVCQERGERCVSLCPPVGVKCLSDETLKYVEEPVGYGSKCTCRRPVCQPAMHSLLPTSCEHLGKKYALGSSFISEDCRGRCTCNQNGFIACVSLCPPENIACPPGYKVSKSRRLIDNSSKCTCPKLECAPDDCVETSHICRHPNRKNYCMNDKYFRHICCETCKQFQ